MIREVKHLTEYMITKEFIKEEEGKSIYRAFFGNTRLGFGVSYIVFPYFSPRLDWSYFVLLGNEKGKAKKCTEIESFYNSHQFSNFVAFVSAPLSPSSSFFLLLSQTHFWSYPGDQLPLQSKKDPKPHFASQAGCLSHLWASRLWKEILRRGMNRREEPQPQEEDKCRLDHRSRCILAPWLNCSGPRVNSPVPCWSIGPEKVWVKVWRLMFTK